MGSFRSTVARASRRPRRKAATLSIRVEARVRGTPREELSRVLPYVDNGLGLTRPEYPKADQQPRRFFPGIESRPVWDPQRFAWMTAFQDAFAHVRAEYQLARRSEDLPIHHQELNQEGTWNVFYFFAGGRRFDKNHELCPRTSELLNRVPGIGEAGQAYFSILAPGTHIPAHMGPTNTRLRCHLGIEVPQGARIRVSNETREWVEGGWIAFDDSFDHEVWIDGPEGRAVLIVDTWHPDLTSAERLAIKRIDPILGATRYGKMADHGSTSRWRGTSTT